MDSTVQASGIACFFVGNALNALLLLMIVMHTPTELRVYSRILVQFIVVDALYLAVYVAVQPVYLNKSENAVVYGLGCLVLDASTTQINRHWNFLLYATWVYVNSFAVYSTPLQFYYRYRVLCRLVDSPRDQFGKIGGSLGA